MIGEKPPGNGNANDNSMGKVLDFNEFKDRKKAESQGADSPGKTNKKIERLAEKEKRRIPIGEERLQSEENQELSAREKDEVEYAIFLFKRNFVFLLPGILAKLKAKSEDPRKIFTIGDETMHPFEADTEFAKEYLYLVESKGEWEKKFTELVREIKNKKNAENLLRQLGEYLVDMHLKPKKEAYLVTEKDIIEIVDEFVKKLSLVAKEEKR